MDDSSLIISLIMSAVSGSAHTVAEIASACGGLYPAELWEILDRLVDQRQLTRTSNRFSIAVNAPTDKLSATPGHVLMTAELPEPHPHDYDWRFDLSTTRRLADRLAQASLPGQRILLLGAPSIFLELERLAYPVYPILLDRNAELMTYLGRFSWPIPCMMVEHDLLGGSLWDSERPVDVALCDPPWYPEHYAAFLAQAAMTVRVGGQTLVSLLPLNTRPAAVTDRRAVIELAHALGFAVSSLEPGELVYKTPLFERSSLAVAGIDVPGDWRQGDLLTLLKVQQPDKRVVGECLTPEARAELEDCEWHEMLFDRYKVKIRGPFDDFAEHPALKSIEEDDTLPSVSRRYEGRRRIDLWFWDNRVFAVKGKAAFLAALHTLAGRPLPPHLLGITQAYRDIAYTELLRAFDGAYAPASRLRDSQFAWTSGMLSPGKSRDEVRADSASSRPHRTAWPETSEAATTAFLSPNAADCTVGFHSFYNSKKRNVDGYPKCRYCGADVIDWRRLHRRDLDDIDFTISQLRREKCRNDWWTKEMDLVARNHALRKGDMRLQDAAIIRLRKSVGEVHSLPNGTRRVYRDGYQTPLSGNSLYYAQHATACCCRRCIQCWHGIPVDRDLTEVEIQYFSALIMTFVRARLPELTVQGQHVPRTKRS